MAARSKSENPKRARATNEQFRELGRFVQEFELMVDEVRSLSLFLVGGHTNRLSVILHHRSMTAAALMDVAVGVIGEMAKEAKYDKTKQAKYDKTKQKDLPELVGQIREEYRQLYELRNTLLHGTWYIGWTYEAQQDFSELTILRGKSSLSEGFAFAKTPRSTSRPESNY